MKKYVDLFFDLDHTLWDFNTNCRHTLDELYEVYDLQKLGFTPEHFFTTYKKINDTMWDGYHKGLVTKEEIRTKRFEQTFERLGHGKSVIPPNIDEDFLAICPAKGQLFPHTLATLDYLAKKGYAMHIITNGFKETQHIKLSTSGLKEYFTHVIESDVCGFMKPDNRIFEYAMRLNNSSASTSIMIGDDLHADVLGAKNVGIDQVFVNRNAHIHSEIITHEIDCLSTLQKIL